MVASTSVAKASPAVGAGRKPSGASRASSAGSCSAAAFASASVRSTASGVPRGAKRPSQLARWKPGAIVSASVGEVREKDVEYADAMKAHVLAFNARVPAAVQKAAERRKLKIRGARVIYHLLDEVCELLGEHLPTHHRPKQQLYDEALARKRALPASDAAGVDVPASAVVVPDFDPDSYLDGNLKRIKRFGRMDLLEVQGYSFPPG